MDIQKIQNFIDVKRQWSSDTMTVLGDKDQGRVEITLDDLQELVAAAQKAERAEGLVKALLVKVEEHKRLEGVEIEIATRKGWADLVDYVTPIAALF